MTSDDMMASACTPRAGAVSLVPGLLLVTVFYQGLSHRSLLWLDERHLTSSARACNIFVCCSIEVLRLSHDTGHLCQKSGVSDRHGRSLWAGQSFDLGTELLRERLDDARAEPGFWLSKDAVRLANPIVSDRKLPICSGNIIRNGDLPFFCIFAECVL